MTGNIIQIIFLFIAPTVYNKHCMKLKRSFYIRSALIVAPDLLGKVLVRKFTDGKVYEGKITEVEAYCGKKDLASHASRGKTPRNKIMFAQGGYLYVYFIYGMYWLANVVAGKKDSPEAILLRGLDSAKGPGRVGKVLGVNKDFYGEDLTKSQRIWIEEGEKNQKLEILKGKRIGLSYGGKWADKLWRFYLADD